MIKQLEADLVQKLHTSMRCNSRLYLIMYEVETGAIYEISLSMQRDFGLRASTFHGQTTSTLTMKQLAPDLLSNANQGALRSKAGCPIVFDTSSLRDTNYWMGDQDELGSEKSISDHNNKKQAAESQTDSDDDRSQAAQLSSFHRANCRAWVCFTQMVEHRQFACVRFIELVKENAEEANPEATLSLNDSFGKPFLKEEMSSDEESDEQLSQIKNFRTVLNNNSSYKAIAYIRWIIAVVGILYLGLFIFVKWLTVNDHANIRDLTLLYANLARRNWILSDAATSTRLFEMTIK